VGEDPQPGRQEAPELVEDEAVGDLLVQQVAAGPARRILELVPRVVRALRDRGVDPNEILLFAGGIIRDEDIPALKELGFREIFRPGASTREIIDYVHRWWAERKVVAGPS